MSGGIETNLSGREANLFRQVVKLYESKQYKKGLKSADQLLKSKPGHGETLAMKGLILSYMNRKNEAYDLVKEGVKNDLKSHVCWHVYGLLHRGDRNYKEAIKCYLLALKHDPDNLQILRDLSLLQIQLRDINGFVETRRKLLSLKANNRNNWISFALAHHLEGNHSVAVQVLDAYSSTQDNDTTHMELSEAHEYSEMILYKAIVMREGGDLKGALKFLQENFKKIKDKTGFMEIKAEILMDLDLMDEAAIVTRQLVEGQPENYDFHRWLCRSLGFDGKMKDEESRQQLVKVYDSLQEQNPRSTACRRIPLEFLEGEEFRQAADFYVRRFIVKGIPSLFRDLKPLYEDNSKAEILGDLFRYYLKCLEENGKLPPLLENLDAESNYNGSHDGSNSPQIVVWVLMYLAQNYNERGETERALECLDAIQAHTPTLIELYSTKSDVLKRAGDNQGGAYYADFGQEMDLADRNLNSAAILKNFEANNAERAEKLSTLFTSEMGVQNSLYDMQCMWYEIAAGRCYMNLGKYGLALKNLRYVSKHFEDFKEDQFDFHQYCIRKMTLRAYLGMLRFEDSVYANKFFFDGATLAVECYLQLYDNPQLAKQDIDTIQKKLKEKGKKGSAQQKKKDAAKSSKGKGEEDGQNDPLEEELGLKFLKEEPLDQAAKLLIFLKQKNGDKLKTHDLAFQVYWRKQKLCLCLQALKAAKRLFGLTNPTVHRMLIKLATLVEQWQKEEESEQTLVHDIISDEVKQMMGERDVASFNKEYLQQQCQGSLKNTLAACQVMYDLDQNTKQDIPNLINKSCNDLSFDQREECIETHKFLLLIGCNDAALAWKQKCKQIYRWSDYFEGEARWGATMDANGIIEQSDSS
eukprot:TRINITY_DN17634_c0_g1_i4.p1 TRINITY_DN17634_c0_g1~~TRINITY_DN17634_c0_g1_i4.p1  ORF type:complete len:865 (-),score=147.57 TRINITY_DN17634_c0_g1_i4:456-3050(-)